MKHDGVHGIPTQGTVVLIHGLWMRGWEMRLLGRRIKQSGFKVCYFSYPSIRRSVSDNAQQLSNFLRALPAWQQAPQDVHLVCHSLGGLVSLTMLHRDPTLRLGRVVAIGSPFYGSWIAKKLSRGPLKIFFGKSMHNGLGGGGPDSVPEQREIAVIAGSIGSKFTPLYWLRSLFYKGLPKPNDGTVTVAETQLIGTSWHRTIALNHMALLFPRTIAEWIVEWLIQQRQ
ncbi:MAG: alpha/beta hydrolase [Magnetococcales bacterium]|nr:alpha/beta hydrolase [Magnetococcales bacterium]